MNLRPVMPRVDRRRRALVEERRDGSAGSFAVVRDETRPARRYSAQADLDRQWRLCDAIPRRPTSLCIWALALQVVLAALATTHLCYHAYQWRRSPLDLTACDFAASPSWLSATVTFTSLLAGLYAFLVLSFRRHKIDDYRGRYRLWYLTTLVLASVGLSRLWELQPLCLSAADFALRRFVAADPAFLRRVLGLVGGSYLGLRLLMEMKASRWARVWLGIAVALAGIRELGGTKITASPFGDVIPGLLLAAAWQALLLSLVGYARLVLLDALEEAEEESGRPTQSRRRRWRLPKWPQWRRVSKATAAESVPTEAAPAKRRVKPAATADAPPVATATNPPVPAPAPPAAERPKPAPPRPAPTIDDDDDDDDESASSSQLSRADRKRLRKEQRRQRHAA